MIKAGFITLSICMLASAASAQMSLEGMNVQMPSKAEMRAELEKAGMSAAQIEQILAAMPETVPAPGGGISASAPPAPCVDENANEICDSEESDPTVTQCRVTYLNVIEKTARDNFGDRLGKRAIEIAQTCSTAAAGGTMYYGYPGGPDAWGEGSKAWYTDMNAMMTISGYWGDVLSYSRYLGDPSDRDLNYDPDNLEGMISQFPPDLQTLLTGATNAEARSGDSFYDKASPIHARCEKIRKRVGASYTREVPNSAVCTRVVPPAPEEGGDK